MWVTVKNSSGQYAVRKIYLWNLGASATKVTYKNQAHQVKISGDTCVLKMVYIQEHLADAVWQELNRDPYAYTKKWLAEHAKVAEPVDVYPPRVYEDTPDIAQVKVRVRSSEERMS